MNTQTLTRRPAVLALCEGALLIALANKLSGEGKAPEEIGCKGCPLSGSCSKLQAKEGTEK